MPKLAVIMLLTFALVPLAAAQGAPEAPTEATDAVQQTPAWENAASAVGDGLRTAGAATGAAAGAVAGGVATARGVALDAIHAIGHGIVVAFTFLGTTLAALGQLVWSGIAALGAGLLAAAKVAARLGGALVSGLGALAASIGAALVSGGSAGFTLARDHPRETAIVAGSAAGAGGLAWLAKRFGLLGLLPLYTRLAPSEMLDNQARADIFEHVKKNPGAHPSAIAEELHLGWGTVVYHLARLESSKLVTIKQGAHRKCYFAVGGDLDAQERAAVAAMSTDKAKLIVQTVRSAPGITQKALADALSMSQALASWHVKRLIANGVLTCAREGRSNTLRVAEHVPVMAPPVPPAAAIPA